MEILHGYAWEILFIPFACVIISQLLKVALLTKNGVIPWHEINKYGGMPSSHTALFVSLMLIVGITTGFNSPLFFISFFVGATFIRDAVGIRWSLGYHGKMLNKIIRDLPEDERKEFPKEPLEERLGHTPKEAIVGALIATTLTLLLHWIVIL